MSKDYDPPRQRSMRDMGFNAEARDHVPPPVRHVKLTEEMRHPLQQRMSDLLALTALPAPAPEHSAYLLREAIEVLKCARGRLNALDGSTPLLSVIDYMIEKNTKT